MSLNPNFLYPLFAMFLLTVFVLFKMLTTRVAAVKSGQVKLGYFRTYREADVPEPMIQAGRHFQNLFEVPVLFYLVDVLGMLFHEGHLFLILAWIYVFARVIHCYIHLGSNNVIHRMRSYVAGWAVLTLMWLLLIGHQIFPLT